MPVFSLSSLFTPTTKDEWESSIYEVLSLLGTDVTSWKSGSVVPAIVTGTSICLGALSTTISYFAAAGYLRTATGLALDAKGQGDYDVQRIDATFATGNVVLDNSSGGVYVLAAGDLVVANPSSGKEYTNVSAETIGAGETGKVVAVVAREAGADSTSVAGEVTSMVTSLNGVTVTNTTAIVGNDAESDIAYVSRCLDSVGAISPNGPPDAYAFVAKSAERPDGSSIGVTRVSEVADGYGNLTVYVATNSGVVAGSDVAIIQEEVEQKCEPLSVAATVESAVALVVDITYQVWMYNDSGLSNSQVETFIAAKLAAWFSTRPIGGDVISGLGYLYHSQISSEIGDSIDEIFRVSVTGPALDVAVAGSEVPVLGTISATVTQVPRR